MAASVASDRIRCVPDRYDPACLIDDPEEIRRQLIEFGRNEALQSASASEIDAETSFYRRPVRVEDFQHMDFSHGLSRDTATSLAALTVHRLLLCVNELETCAPKDAQNAEQARQRDAYCSEESRFRGALIRPFLERFGFAHADRYTPAPRAARACEEEFHEWAAWSDRYWRGLLARLARHNYLQEGIRFALVQKWCLHRAKRTALRIADAAGFLSSLRPEDRPRLTVDDDVGSALAAAAASVGLSRPEHSYWQFYLATSLAEANLLYALKGQSSAPLRLIGAAFLAELDATVLRDALRAFGSDQAAVDRDGTSGIEDVAARFRRALQTLCAQGGAAAVQEIASGWAMARSVAECAQADLAAQLSWIARVGEYLDIAREIRERIRVERPSIERETFTEPREMCSTTHVHDDHRLVEIESGRMVFWANCGMRLRLDPGDVMFVPKGRLHGSTVESDVCRYHQPIIPEEWLTSFIGWRD